MVLRGLSPLPVVLWWQAVEYKLSRCPLRRRMRPLFLPSYFMPLLSLKQAGLFSRLSTERSVQLPFDTRLTKETRQLKSAEFNVSQHSPFFKICDRCFTLKLHSPKVGASRQNVESYCKR